MRTLSFSFRKSPEDFLKWLLFELGAGFYADKLSCGPEAELRCEFAEFFLSAFRAAPDAPTRLLDVGCGPGHLGRYLAEGGREVTGVDRSSRLLKIARRLAIRSGHGVSFAKATTDHLPFPDATFDGTCATTVIYFVAHPERAMSEMRRVTRRGGIVATLDPHSSMSVEAMRNYCSRNGIEDRDRRKLIEWALAARFNRRFAEEELRGLFRGAGLDEVTLERRWGGMVWFACGRVAE